MISIVTITYNNFDELIQTLSSIQGLSNIQSIVINGGTCVKTRNYLLTYPGISVSESDRGISDAFNKGLKLATGLAVMYLNSGDILIDKDYISWAQETLNNNINIDFTYSDIIYNDSDIGQVKVNAINSDHRSLARGMPYPHQSLIVRTNVINEVGSFDEAFSFCMDFDLVLRMKINNSKGIYFNKPTVLMDGNGTSSRNELRTIGEVYKALRKNKKLNLRIVFRLVLSILIYSIRSVVNFLGLKNIKIILKKMRFK